MKQFEFVFKLEVVESSILDGISFQIVSVLMT